MHSSGVKEVVQDWAADKPYPVAGVTEPRSKVPTTAMNEAFEYFLPPHLSLLSLHPVAADTHVQRNFETARGELVEVTGICSMVSDLKSDGQMPRAATDHAPYMNLHSPSASSDRGGSSGLGRRRLRCAYTEPVIKAARRGRATEEITRCMHVQGGDPGNTVVVSPFDAELGNTTNSDGSVVGVHLHSQSCEPYTSSTLTACSTCSEGYVACTFPRCNSDLQGHHLKFEGNPNVPETLEHGICDEGGAKPSMLARERQILRLHRQLDSLLMTIYSWGGFR